MGAQRNDRCGYRDAVRGPISWVALPFTVFADIITLPILLIGALEMGVLEGLSLLQGD